MVIATVAPPQIRHWMYYAGLIYTYKICKIHKTLHGVVTLFLQQLCLGDRSAGQASLQFSGKVIDVTNRFYRLARRLCTCASNVKLSEVRKVVRRWRTSGVSRPNLCGVGGGGGGEWLIMIGTENFHKYFCT